MYSKELKKLCSLKKVVSVFIGGSNWGWSNWESYAFWMVCWVLALAGVLSGFCVVSPQVARSVADFGDPNVVHLALGASPAIILHALPYFPEPDSRIQSPSTSNRAAPQAEQRRLQFLSYFRPPVQHRQKGQPTSKTKAGRFRRTASTLSGSLGINRKLTICRRVLVKSPRFSCSAWCGSPLSLKGCQIIGHTERIRTERAELPHARLNSASMWAAKSGCVGYEFQMAEKERALRLRIWLASTCNG